MGYWTGESYTFLSMRLMLMVEKDTTTTASLENLRLQRPTRLVNGSGAQQPYTVARRSKTSKDWGLYQDPYRDLHQDQWGEVCLRPAVLVDDSCSVRQ